MTLESVQQAVDNCEALVVRSLADDGSRERHAAMRYIWDDDKAKENIRNHRVTFEEAETVFDDPLSTTYHDPDHSISEERYLEIGYSNRGRLLIISYTQYLEDGEEYTRIISARLATRHERRQYEEG